MKARFAVLAAMSVGMVVLLAGCGDDGSSDGSASAGGSASADGSAPVTVTTSSLSKDEFLKKAGAACEREREGLVGEVTQYLGQHRDDGLPPGVLVANMVEATLIPAIEAEISAVRALGAPAGDEEEVEALLSAQQGAVDEVKAEDSFESLEAVEERFDPAERLYRDYGFVQCLNGTL